MSDLTYIDSTVEALILASPEPLPGRKVAQLIEDLTPSAVAKTVARLNTRYTESGVSFRIREIAGGYQHYILSDYVGYVEEMFSRRRKLRLTKAALETAAIIAYRQPVTKAEIEHIRGVASDGVLQNLLEKQMITIVGRANTVGKPLQYGSTDEFLKFFGLNSIDDLPKMSEIEELIAAQEAKNQTELQLDSESMALGSQKLNIIDGTFDPKSRELDLDEETKSNDNIETNKTDDVDIEVPAENEKSESSNKTLTFIHPEENKKQEHESRVKETLIESEESISELNSTES